MKAGLFPLAVIVLVAISGCGGKKTRPAEVAQISSQYELEAFDDVDEPSTLDLEALKSLPRMVDLKSIMTPVKDQGERGTCTFFSAIAIVEAAIKSKMKIDVNLSEEYLNYLIKSRGFAADTDGGNTFINLYEVIENKGEFLLERDWPYQPTWFNEKKPCIGVEVDGPDVPKICYTHNAPPASVMAKKIPVNNFTFTFIGPETTNGIIEYLATKKLPVSIGLAVNHKGWPDSGETQYSEEMRKECIEKPTLCGGHAVVLTGYDLDKQVFFFKNSWSKKWGNEGFGTIPFSVIDLHARKISTSVSLNENIKLPKDHAKDYLNLNSYDVASEELSDKSVQVKAFGKIENVGFHYVEMASTLVKKPSSLKEIPDEKNTKNVQTSEGHYVSVSKNFFPEKEEVLMAWQEDSPLVNVVSAEKMQDAAVVDLKNSSLETQLFVRSTLYVYTDDSAYKILKRIYHPINHKRVVKEKNFVENLLHGW